MEYRLCWDSFQTWTKESMRDLYEDNDYTDITLITEDMQVFKSHRIVLSSCSDFFKEILGKMKSFQGQTLYMKEIQSNILGLLLNFIYLGEVSVSQECIPQFLSTAVDLKIKGIDFEEKKDIMKEIKKDKIDEETSCSLEMSTLEEIEMEIKKTEDQIQNESLEIDNVELKTKTEDVADTGAKISHASENDEKGENPKCFPKNYETRKSKKKKGHQKHKKISSPSDDVKGESDYKHSEEEFICVYDTCNETFKTSKEAKKHIIKTHSKPMKEKKFQCETCNKKFQTKHEANLHWQFKHGNKEKKFSCDICSKKFFQSGDLKMHKKGVHLKIKDFHCTFCDFAFSQNCNLKTHLIKMHTEEYYNQLKVKEPNAENGQKG